MVQEETPLVEAERAGRHYSVGHVDAVIDASFKVDGGECVAIIGKSGSGKSTLLNLIGGLDQPTSGEIRFDGKTLTGDTNLDRHRARNVGFVFQDYFLLPNLTAAENVQIPMFESDWPLEDRIARAEQLLTQVGLAGRERHLPAQLSGGECQRVAVARALANQPRLILADEPTGALDTETGNSILDLLEALNQTEAITLIIVTHDDAVASRAQRQICMVDGRIEESVGQ